MAGLVLVLLAIVSAVAALRGSTPMESQAPPVSVQARGAHVPHDEGAAEGWLGVIIADEAVDLAAPGEGRVESIRVQVGDPVMQGDVVATLESLAAKQDLAVAEAELLSRRAEQRVAALSLEEARERRTRRETPDQIRTGAISDEELSTVRYQERLAAAKLEMAQAQVLEREARVAQLRRNVTETSIRAPFHGVVASRFVTVGALLQAGQPVIHLLRKGAVQARFAISASEAPQVPVGQRLVLKASEQGWVRKGRVTRVAPEVDVAALKVFVQAEMEASPGTVAPSGTVVRVRVDPEPVRAGISPMGRSTSNNP